MVTTAQSQDSLGGEKQARTSSPALPPIGPQGANSSGPSGCLSEGVEEVSRMEVFPDGSQGSRLEKCGTGLRRGAVDPNPQRIGGSSCNERPMGPRVPGTMPRSCLRRCTMRVYL